METCPHCGRVTQVGPGASIGMLFVLVLAVLGAIDLAVKIAIAVLR